MRMNKIATPRQPQARRTWGQSISLNSSSPEMQRQQPPPPPPSPPQQLQQQQQHQQHQQRQQRMQRPAVRMPVSSGCSVSVSAAPHTPRTVIVGDMVVADDSDTEGDIIDEEVEDESDEDKPKVLRVITRRPARTAATAGAEPAWHALLRRTSSTRTASIARTPPRVAPTARPAQHGQQHGVSPPGPQGSCRTRPMQPRPVQLYTTPSRIIRADGSSKPAVNVPAKVLVPRNRLLFPLLAHGRVLPVNARMPMGVAYRRQDAGDAPQVGVVRRVLVSAVGPLSPAESAVLDGVLDLLDEHQARYGGIKAYMEKYGVTAMDTFPDPFP